MKKYLLLLIVPIALMFASCMKDTSAYYPQGKDDVNVDAPTEEEEPLPETEGMKPGIHTVELSVPVSAGGEEVEKRRFKYFMPVSLNSTKPVSLIFEFHGSYTYSEGAAAPQPLNDYGTNYTLNKLGTRNNAILIYPLGLDENYSIGWGNAEKNLLFVDAMLNYFKKQNPTYDPARVYSTGQSSGGIFSFVLAAHRSEVFASVAPRAGQMRGIDVVPTRAVPIRAFNGTLDNIVNHGSAITNMTGFASTIGGYYANDMVYNERDTLSIPGYCKYQVRYWEGAKADYQIFSLLGEGHNVATGLVQELMWDFFDSHTLNSNSVNHYLSLNTYNIAVDCGLKGTIEIKTNPDAIITFNAPSDWNPILEEGVLKLKAPEDFMTCENRSGEIEIISNLNGIIKSRTVQYKLNPPKPYFEVGDIYYDDNFNPIGVICWVNPKNIGDAKVVYAFAENGNGAMRFGNFSYSNPTPSEDDGEGNTKFLMEKYIEAGSPGTETYSYVWCYNLENKSGWYLPAINELLLLAENLEIVNTKIASIGGDLIFPNEGDDSYMSSTTTVVEGKSKTFNYYDFTLKQASKFSTKKGLETAYYNVIAMKHIKK